MQQSCSVPAEVAYLWRETKPFGPKNFGLELTTANVKYFGEKYDDVPDEFFGEEDDESTETEEV